PNSREGALMAADALVVALARREMSDERADDLVVERAERQPSRLHPAAEMNGVTKARAARLERVPLCDQRRREPVDMRAHGARAEALQHEATLEKLLQHVVSLLIDREERRTPETTARLCGVVEPLGALNSMNFPAFRRQHARSSTYRRAPHNGGRRCPSSDRRPRGTSSAAPRSSSTRTDRAASAACSRRASSRARARAPAARARWCASGAAAPRPARARRRARRAPPRCAGRGTSCSGSWWSPPSPP